MTSGVLHLIPTWLSEEPARPGLPAEVLSIINELKYFIVEEEKTARRFLKRAGVQAPIATLQFSVINEHSKTSEVDAIIERLKKGENAGLMSEAGCPCIADPGEMLVRRCQQAGIRVVPYVGPSSILLALMASGLNGQRFSFQGYVPVDEPDRSAFLRNLESESAKIKQTQIFMDTPYRSDKLFSDILRCCKGTTVLCVATDVTGPHESIETRSIANWKQQNRIIGKKPTMFVLSAT